MSLFGRNRPPEAVAAMTFDRGERPLAWASSSEGWVVATRFGLWEPVADGSVRTGWERIDKATWRDGVLTVLPTGGRPTVHEVLDAGRLPQVVYERVTSAIVVNRHVRLVEDGGVRVVGRRRPTDSRMVWTVHYDRGLDEGDPALRARVDAVVEAVREEVGE